MFVSLVFLYNGRQMTNSTETIGVRFRLTSRIMFRKINSNLEAFKGIVAHWREDKSVLITKMIVIGATAPVVVYAVKTFLTRSLIICRQKQAHILRIYQLPDGASNRGGCRSRGICRFDGS